MLPPPKPLVNVGKTVALDNVVIIVGTAIEVVGGMDGRGVVPYDLHEGMIDHRRDYRDPATPIINQNTTGHPADIDTGQNNKAGARLGKKKKEAIKNIEYRAGSEQIIDPVAKSNKKVMPLQINYGDVNSEDEIDPDNESIN